MSHNAPFESETAAFEWSVIYRLAWSRTERGTPSRDVDAKLLIPSCFDGV